MEQQVIEDEITIGNKLIASFMGVCTEIGRKPITMKLLKPNLKLNQRGSRSFNSSNGIILKTNNQNNEQPPSTR